MTKNSDFSPVEDYFIIGDLRTAALISKSGSIDWLCLPNFDSASVFGKLLDPSAGTFAIEMPSYATNARYIKDTSIVELTLSKARSKIIIKDFMVPRETKQTVNQFLVRSISTPKGTAKVTFKFQLKPQYGVTKPKLKYDNGNLGCHLNGGLLKLHLPVGSEVKAIKGVYYVTVLVQAGKDKELVLEYVAKGHQPSKLPTDFKERTQHFWQKWIKRGNYFDFCRDSLVRSAIALKLMQFYPTGAIVAAPTTSLPETLGGIRNWDYRYVWIRDATFALYAFTILGHQEEAEHFFGFIEKVTQECAQQEFDVSLMYTIWGEAVPKERVIKHLSGYRNSRPVRIGNAASKQFQLDVYGSLIDAIYFATKEELTGDSKAKRRKLVMELVRKIDKLWQKPDHGIWEARIGQKHYTYSKVMAWVGADRAKRLEKYLDLKPKDLKICERLAESINEWIWQNCYKQNRRVLTQYPDTQAVDATNLLFVLLQFLDKHKPVTRQIIDNTAKELGHNKAFVYRYLKADGLTGDEGAFVLCSFWLISALAILEDVKSALDLFKRLEEYMKPHGLLSEEIDPKTKEYLGNYPQAFSHLGYIMSTHYLHKYAGRQNIKL